MYFDLHLAHLNVMTLYVPRTILIVDDEPSIVDLLAQVLRESGYEVLEAGSAADAISLCTQFASSIHLVLSDFTMPRLNGIQLAKRLRTIRPNLRFIFMSASPNAFEELAVEGFMCLPKPFALPDLLERIREMLRAA